MATNVMTDGMLQLAAGKSTYNDLPYNGKNITFKTDDPESKKPQMAHKARAQVFDMSKPDDVKAYIETWQDIVSGLALPGIEELEYSTDTNNWRILMRWVEQFYVHPDE